MAIPDDIRKQINEEARLVHAQGWPLAEKQALFTLIVEQAGPYLLGAALRIFQRKQDAMDAYQAGLMKAWKNTDKWEPRGPFLAWLLILIANAGYDDSRRRQRQQRNINALNEHFRHQDLSAAGGSPTPEDSLISKANLEEVKERMASLTEKARTILWKVTVDGQSIGDVASEEGTTVSAITTAVHRARARLSELKP